MITAEVFLWGTRIGAVAQKDITSLPVFNYDKNFLKSHIEIAPLTMPLSNVNFSFPNLSERTFHRLPGLLADSLPDKFGTKLIERYLSEQGRDLKSLTSVERLLYIGKRGMGALEYVPAKNYGANLNSNIDIDALVKLASDILTERESLTISNKSNAMEQIINVGTSAGGARAKAVIAWNQKTNEIRSGQIDAGEDFEYWLLKFDGVENNKDKGPKADDPAYTRIEYAYYLMAIAAGINMNECRLYQENGRYHFMTKRFDRTSKGEKLHMQTLGAIAHFDYNMPGAHSYEQAGWVLNQLGLGVDSMQELFRRMVFNVIARNQDDHVKNISFLMNKQGNWSLSPAYDITYANDPNNFWLSKHQMTINGRTEGFVVDDFYETAKKFNISKTKTKTIIDEVYSAVLSWKQFAGDAYIPEPIAMAIEAKFLSLK